MKKIIYLISKIFALGFFTLMIVIDNFPEIGIHMSVGTAGVIIFIAIAVFTRKKGEPVYKSSKQELIYNLLSGIYLFSLFIILKLLGGNSQTGIGLTNPVIWGLFLIGLLISYTKYRKEVKIKG